MHGFGSSDGFTCMEMEMVASQVQKVKDWKQRGGDIIGIQIVEGENNLLLNALSNVHYTFL